MDQLKQGIGLQAYGQKDPVVQYKMMGYDMFDEMTQAITEDTVRLLMHIQVEEKVEREQVAKVTGTNKDEGPSVKGPVKRTDKKIYPVTHMDSYSFRPSHNRKLPRTKS